MALDFISNLVSDDDPTPNKFTIAMGELIKEACNQAEFSLKELAELINLKQTTVSDIEYGKIEVNSGVLVVIAATLDKPLTYFFPSIIYREFKVESFPPWTMNIFWNFEKYGMNIFKELLLIRLEY